MRYLTCAFFAALLILCHACHVVGEDLNVPLEKMAGGNPGSMMHNFLMGQARQTFQQWKTEYESRKTSEQIAAYQKRMREQALLAIGGLPERTALEPRVAGSVSRPGYRVEKILIQSQPRHHVSALLFLPAAERFKPPYPGVIVPCGHAKPAKGHPEYQSMGALLALTALVIDPIDQGERGQYLGPGGWPKLWGSAGHTMAGISCILLGQNVARFEIWDNIRAIDYLQSRREVDPQRIGCTGNSGGGTQTSYAMALDDRIRAAAPSCALTSTPRLLETIGDDDAEQQLFGQLDYGLHHADWIMMRAPSPVLICAATQDFFDIAGTWDSFRYAKRLYTRLGFSERVDLLENPAAHNFNTVQREGVARWMSRWLLGKDQVISEPPITLLTEKEYQCTPEGTVMSIPSARSVYDLNRDQENELARRRKAEWAAEKHTALLDQVRRLAGIRKLSELPRPRVETLGTVARTGYRVEKLLITVEKGIWLPALWFVPEKQKPRRAVLYVHDQGKATDAGPGGPIEQRVRGGDAVLAVDLRGTGQTRSNTRGWGSPDHQDGYLAYLLGRSYVGMRAEDVLSCARYAAERADGKAEAIDLVAIGHVGIPAVHAAALEPNLFRSVRLRRTLVSWSNMIHKGLHNLTVMSVVHGALTHYDLPDLAATLGIKLTVEQAVDAEGAVMR
jgi:dienelactone hydrolase